MRFLPQRPVSVGEAGEEGRGEIALGKVRDDRYDQLAGAGWALGDFARGLKRGTG